MTERAHGWAIGSDRHHSAVILHTDNGGGSWKVQGDKSLWKGLGGTDISAVDARTAWASLGSGNGKGGRIVHTRNGGMTWRIQDLPVDVPKGVKGVKAVDREEAWAVGLQGPLMHTVDGGTTWEIVSTGDVTLQQVNRIDVLGEDIWIADFGAGETGMIHSADGGNSWRREKLPEVTADHGPMTIAIVDSRVAWTTVNFQGDIYRTLDGGDTWNLDAPRVSGPNDIDDLCAASDRKVWAVQNISGASRGYIMLVTIDGSEALVKDWAFNDYVYEGITAFDTSTAWAVGFKAVAAAADLPRGSILHTSDGKDWVSQAIPVDDVELWKVSFAGAGR